MTNQKSRKPERRNVNDIDIDTALQILDMLIDTMTHKRRKRDVAAKLMNILIEQMRDRGVGGSLTSLMDLLIEILDWVTDLGLGKKGLRSLRRVVESLL